MCRMFHGALFVGVRRMNGKLIWGIPVAVCALSAWYLSTGALVGIVLSLMMIAINVLGYIEGQRSSRER